MLDAGASLSMYKSPKVSLDYLDHSQAEIEALLLRHVPRATLD